MGDVDSARSPPVAVLNCLPGIQYFRLNRFEIGTNIEQGVDFYFASQNDRENIGDSRSPKYFSGLVNPFLLTSFLPLFNSLKQRMSFFKEKLGLLFQKRLPEKVGVALQIVNLTAVLVFPAVAVWFLPSYLRKLWIRKANIFKIQFLSGWQHDLCILVWKNRQSSSESVDRAIS